MWVRFNIEKFHIITVKTIFTLCTKECWTLLGPADAIPHPGNILYIWHWHE